MSEERKDLMSSQSNQKGSQAPAQRPPVQPIKQSAPKSSSRRSFIKALVTLGAILSLAPYVPWGQYLTSSVSAGSGRYQRQRVVIDNKQEYGAAAGQPVKVNDLNLFPPNSHWVFTYPSSGNIDLDSQNPDTFVKWELIRLPIELGGDKPDASSFVAFSKVCVHLWCSPNYNPEQCSNPNENGYRGNQAGCTKHMQYECPCHGSIYRIPDGLAIEGPAALQPPPTNAIPMLTLSTDSDGYLYVEPPIWDVDHNGIIGYGRYVKGVKG